MSARSAYVGIAACGHVRAAAAFDSGDLQRTAEAVRYAKGWKRSGLQVELWTDIDRVRAAFGSCEVCDPQRKPKPAQQLGLFQ